MNCNSTGESMKHFYYPLCLLLIVFFVFSCGDPKDGPLPVTPPGGGGGGGGEPTTVDPVSSVSSIVIPGGYRVE